MVGILVVEDREVIANVLRDMLVSNGHTEVETAYCGQDAIEVFHRKRPKVIILDLLLPDMNGLDVASKLLELDPDLRIIAMTAMSGEGLLDEVLKAGCAGLLTKPFRMRDLLGMVDAVSG